MTNSLEGLVQNSTRLSLPETLRTTEQVLAGALRLPNVIAIEITPTSILIDRLVPPDTEVLPPALRALHAGVMLEPALVDLIPNITLEALAFEAGGHILHLLLALFDKVRLRDLTPVALFARHGDELPAALGLPHGTAVTHLFCVPVYYVGDELEEGSVLLLGSTNAFVSDATYGVVADIGGGV